MLIDSKSKNFCVENKNILFGEIENVLIEKFFLVKVEILIKV